MESVVIFEELVRQQKPAELVEFLLGLGKADIVPVRQMTRQLSRKVDEFWEYEPGKWGSRGTPTQRHLLFLAGLRTYSHKEAFANGFSIWPLRSLSKQEQTWFWQVLECARPTWLSDWLLNRAEANTWAMPDYELLRELERRDLIAYEPKLFALAAPGVLATLGQELNQQEVQPTDLLATLVARLGVDTTLLQRDLPLVFAFDTNVDGVRAQVQKPQPGGWPGAINWHEWNRRHPAQVVGWLDALPALGAAGHLDRNILLHRCQLALRREFRRPLLSWLKELYGRLAPNPAECLAHQGDLVELLAHAQPLVVNFALDQLKTLWAAPGFDLAPLLEYADLLVRRPELKASLAGLLSGLTRLVRTGAAPALPVARVLTTALAHPHAAVQERAARCLAELLKQKKSPFAPAELTEVQAALGQQHELLGAKAGALLATWLVPLTASRPAAPYAVGPAFVPELSAATAIVPVADWPELLYLTGQVLRHDDPLALERWLDGLLRLQAQLPTTFAEQLLPYLHRLLPGIEKQPLAEADEELATCTTSGHLGLVQALALSWYRDFRVQRVPATILHGPHLAPDPLVAVEKQRLGFVEQLLHEGLALPLLSTPTHAPHWLAPTALVERLLAYEAADVAPCPADLAVALTRTAYQHPAAAAAALGRLPELQHAGLRNLLAWLLASETQPLPATLAPPMGRLRQFTVRLGLLLPTSPAAQPATLAEALPWLWAVAARTRQPTAALPALETLAPAAGLTQPWQPTWEVAEASHSYVQNWLPGKPTHTDTWTELRLSQSGPAMPAPTPLLLYSLHAARPLLSTAPTWYQLSELATDYPFLASLLPQHPAPLHYQALHLAARRADEPDGTTVNILLHALHPFLLPGPALDEAATLVLAAGLGHAAPAARALAQQVLRATVAQARLCPAHLGRTLGHLLAAGYVPAPRLTDSLLPLRTDSPTAPDALRQLLEVLLSALPAPAPRQLRRLLELYADLQAQLSQPVPTALRERLTSWDAGVLKPVSAALLAAA